jgi:hypothetical protein
MVNNGVLPVGLAPVGQGWDLPKGGLVLLSANRLTFGPVITAVRSL